MLKALKSRLASATPSDAIWAGAGDDVIGLHGQDGCFLRVSESASTLLGQSPDALIGKPLQHIIELEDQPTLFDALARIEERKGGGRARFDCRLRNGRERRSWAEISLALLPGGALRSVIRPIEHRLAREAQIRHESDAALRDVARQQEHLANVTHEIRTPLNAVIGFADALHAERFGPMKNERYREYARTIYEGGEHLRDLISDLLDLSKAEANEIPVNLTATDPSSLVTACAQMMELEATKAGLFLKVDIDPSVREAALDQKIVRQILLNLISNALKFTKEGGITLTLRRDGGMLSFSVVDTGIGMSQDDLALIGRRFKQARTEGVRGTRGTGIGLALSKALARVHGGELRLVSTVGAGTTALLRLPFKQPERSGALAGQAGGNVTRLSDAKRA